MEAVNSSSEDRQNASNVHEAGAIPAEETVFPLEPADPAQTLRTFVISGSTPPRGSAAQTEMSGQSHKLIQPSATLGAATTLQVRGTYRFHTSGFRFRLPVQRRSTREVPRLVLGTGLHPVAEEFDPLTSYRPVRSVSGGELISLPTRRNSERADHATRWAGCPERTDNALGRVRLTVVARRGFTCSHACC